MKVFAFVFARGGSKGLPGKNLTLLGDKPLVAWSIDVVHQVPEVGTVFVSTEDPEIARVAAQYDAQVIERPAVLASDTAPEWLSWQHAVRHVMQTHGGFDIFVSAPPTSPLRTADDISAAITSLSGDTDAVVTMTESARSPWFNMVKRADDGTLSTVLENDGSIARRQDAPKTYDLTTVAYVARPQFILSASNIWDGCVRGVEVSYRSAVDIDSRVDLEYAEFLLQRTGEEQE